VSQLPSESRKLLPKESAPASAPASPRDPSLEPPQAALPVVVIGAGPVGLAALANLMERGIAALVLEAGDRVGANFRDFGHVGLFSPWRYSIAGPIAARLAREGWQSPDPEALPLAAEVVERVLEPYAALPEVRAAIRLRHRVIDVTRDGFDKVKTAGRERAPFVLRVAAPEGPARIPPAAQRTPH
jgi:cation diffusion facilitator CzcD-associated flavoprotein CzcO